MVRCLSIDSLNSSGLKGGKKSLLHSLRVKVWLDRFSNIQISNRFWKMHKMCPNSVICVLLGLTVSMYTLAKQQASFVKIKAIIQGQVCNGVQWGAREPEQWWAWGPAQEAVTTAWDSVSKRGGTSFSIFSTLGYNLESYGKFLLANSLSFLTLLPYLF